jgi:hypothetical protein
MPAKSEKQREAIAIAEHSPEKLYKRNEGILGMSHKQMHDFASTKGLAKGRPRLKSGNALRNAVYGSSQAITNVAKSRKKYRA